MSCTNMSIGIFTYVHCKSYCSIQEMCCDINLHTEGEKGFC